MTVLCRTCCKNINTDEKSFVLDTLLNASNNTESLHRVLKSLFPTVKFDSVYDPVVCNTCYLTVVNFHNFKQECLKNEATLRNYIRNNDIKTKIRLAEVFSTKCVVKIEEEEIFIKEEPEEICDDTDNEIEHTELNPADEINVNSLLKKHETEWVDSGKFAGNKCKYYQCGRSNREESSLRKFAFPVNDKERYKIWLINSGNAHLLGVDPSQTTKMYICHYHFDKKYILNKRLAPTAIPEPCFPPQITKEKEMLECFECNEKFYSSNEIARHIKHAHGSIRCIACKLCNKFFACQDAFKLHLAVHKTVKKKTYNVCKRCNKKFDSLESLQRHKKIIHPKSVFCSVCKVRLLNYQAFEKHFKTTHANSLESTCNNESKICDYCGLKYSKCSNLSVHMKRFHREYVKKKPQQEFYLCDVCGKTFKTNRTLFSHKKQHQKGKAPTLRKTKSQKFGKTRG